MTEKDFIEKMTEDDQPYLLPEFVSAFLLAKDIEMEFTGIDSETQVFMKQQSAERKLSGNFACFTASSAFDYGDADINIHTESTIDGLKIKIPGAQAIGYYTTILPCFPNNLCSKKRVMEPVHIL